MCRHPHAPVQRSLHLCRAAFILRVVSLQASTLASARLPLHCPRILPGSRRRGCSDGIQVTILSFVWASPKTGFRFLSTDGYILTDWKNCFRLRYSLFRQQGFLFLHWHKMECLSGERRADRQGNRQKMVHNNRFYNGSGKRFSIHRSKASDCTESGGVSMITASPLRI